MNRIFSLLILIFALFSGYAQVLISDDPTYTTPQANSVLDLNSTTKGFLLPRLTTAQVTALGTSIPEGLVVYNKETHKFLGWDGTTWQNLGYEEANTPPYFSANPAITSSNGFTIGATLTSSFTLADADGADLVNLNSTKIWQLADDNLGTNAATIAGQTATTYTTVNPTDLNKFIRSCVTPNSTTGVSPGSQVCTAWYGAMIVAANAAPVASAVSITGLITQGQTLTGNYTYTDAETDLEATSTFRWTRSDDNIGIGINETTIAGATSSTYTLVAGDIGKYIKFYVTPIAATGTITGTEVGSGFVGPI